MTYTEALEYIHGISNFFCKPGLERITELCRGLNDPQNSLKFIHVGGTNGKGSFCAMTDSILRAAGYKVGLYTSPYVREFNERMRVDEKNIPNETLARLTEKVKAVAERMADPPTEFELITAIAFEYFKEEGCQIVILEVGMGGRLDATNVINAPLLSVITGIALDHTAYLGDTIAAIAKEKAGIIKQGCPTLYGGENEEAAAVITKKADEVQTILYKTDYSKLKIDSLDLCGTNFSYKEREGLMLSMLGEYQPKNACIVLDAIDLLTKSGFSVGEDAIRRGLYEAGWPARFEIIHENPTVIFDGAHNPQGIRAAVDSIKGYFGDKKVVIMTGVLRDKDYNTVAESISEVAEVAFTITPSNPRALSAEEYASVLGSKGVSSTPCNSIEEALSRGMIYAKEKGSALCCLGSLYTYGEVISVLQALD